MNSRSCQRGISDFGVGFKLRRDRKNDVRADVDVEILAPADVEDLRHARRFHEAVARDDADEGIGHPVDRRRARSAERAAFPRS